MVGPGIQQDLFSRGLNPALILDHQLWWEVPECLGQMRWPHNICSLSPDEIPEIRSSNIILNMTTIHYHLFNSVIRNGASQLNRQAN